MAANPLINTIYVVYTRSFSDPMTFLCDGEFFVFVGEDNHPVAEAKLRELKEMVGESYEHQCILTEYRIKPNGLAVSC